MLESVRQYQVTIGVCHSVMQGTTQINKSNDGDNCNQNIFLLSELNNIYAMPNTCLYTFMIHIINITHSDNCTDKTKDSNGTRNMVK